jgi:hypothetical protein
LRCPRRDGTLALRRRGAQRDALLPLAPRIDAIAAALAGLERVDEQARRRRRRQPPTGVARPGATVTTVPWHEASESRWRVYVHQKGDEFGVLARLKMTGAERVPARYRRHVDAILHPLLDNALQYGIENLEQRLSAHKPAAGQITVAFRDMGADGIEMTVHDDGEGFDLDRIGRAAVMSGLLSTPTVDRRNEAKLVGLIFRPTFTTEGCPAAPAAVAAWRWSAGRSHASAGTSPWRPSSIAMRSLRSACQPCRGHEPRPAPRPRRALTSHRAGECNAPEGIPGRMYLLIRPCSSRQRAAASGAA